MVDKTPGSIRIDRTTAVTWNKDAFNRLVIAPDTKEILLAAITSHGAHNGPTADLIAGKGQGLLILLHGGPGTGKTLTAESIAEAQEKPLYRVTCGDIGMEPQDVEVVWLCPALSSTRERTVSCPLTELRST